mmetsp:Transcript_59657/g.96610  ORF Transcript_59657/g.96610 Transcript_59657/m.96610 type:complete len:208 (-) Transcript_59657:478-1101(-)
MWACRLWRSCPTLMRAPCRRRCACMASLKVCRTSFTCRWTPSVARLAASAVVLLQVVQVPVGWEVQVWVEQAVQAGRMRRMDSGTMSSDPQAGAHVARDLEADAQTEVQVEREGVRPVLLDQPRARCSRAVRLLSMTVDPMEALIPPPLFSSKQHRQHASWTACPSAPALGAYTDPPTSSWQHLLATCKRRPPDTVTWDWLKKLPSG